MGSAAAHASRPAPGRASGLSAPASGAPPAPDAAVASAGLRCWLRARAAELFAVERLLRAPFPVAAPEVFRHQAPDVVLAGLGRQIAAGETAVGREAGRSAGEAAVGALLLRKGEGHGGTGRRTPDLSSTLAQIRGPGQTAATAGQRRLTVPRGDRGRSGGPPSARLAGEAAHDDEAKYPAIGGTFIHYLNKTCFRPAFVQVMTLDCLRLAIA